MKKAINGLQGGGRIGPVVTDAKLKVRGACEQTQVSGNGTPRNFSCTAWIRDESKHRMAIKVKALRFLIEEGVKGL